MAQAESTVTGNEPTTSAAADDGWALARRTTVGTLLAVVLALGLRTVAVELGPGLAALDPFNPLAIAGSVVVAGAGAAVVYAAAVRFSDAPVAVFLGAAVVVFVGMLVPVLVVAPDLGVGDVGQAWLIALHGAVAVPLVIAVARLGSAR